MTRLDTLRRTLTGAALISSPQHVYYLSRFSFEDGYLLVTSDAAYLLTDFRYEEAARRGADPDFTVISPETGAFSAIADLLRRHGEHTLLVEEAHVTLALRDRLAAALPDVCIKGGVSAALIAARGKKDESEIAAIRHAQSITDAAFTHILDFITPTRTEREVALELDTFMRRMGAEDVAFPTIAVSGAASALPHGVPRDVPLERGFLTMDFGARAHGYCSDMTRTVSIGRADEEMRRVYDTVLRAQRAALDAARVGIPHRTLDLTARAIIEDAGFVGCFGHSLGHGVGLDIHEAPRLSQYAREDALLTPGEVVTVEPGIYVQGRLGCRIEDLIVVTESGICNLTKSTKELIEL